MLTKGIKIKKPEKADEAEHLLNRSQSINTIDDSVVIPKKNHDKLKERTA